jgi:hypothetical protein
LIFLHTSLSASRQICQTLCYFSPTKLILGLFGCSHVFIVSVELSPTIS